ncbi:unnamed protein product [Closterium sp. Yama58-4]|nr:unnamed protein product [Closterium sp. Yama58-4]
MRPWVSAIHPPSSTPPFTKSPTRNLKEPNSLFLELHACSPGVETNSTGAAEVEEKSRNQLATSGVDMNSKLKRSRVRGAAEVEEEALLVILPSIRHPPFLVRRKPSRHLLSRHLWSRHLWSRLLWS